jgi:ABC-type transport system involved in multi-copper enzyme maturation permease subunit
VSGTLVVARHTLQEALRRRVLIVVLALTAVFGGLYAWGAAELFKDVSGFANDPSGLDADALAGATILGLAMFGSLFLGTVLAVFLSVGAVRGDAERGLLQPLVVRPLGRTQYLLGRFLAAAAVSAAYVLLAVLAAVLVTGLIGGWWPEHPFQSALLLALAAVLISALALLGSVFLTVTANGICVLMAYGAGLLAGLLGEIGDAIPSPTLKDIADVTSWVLPFEALYRDALRLLVQDVPGVTGAIVRLGPLGGSHDSGPLLVPWAIAYVALVLAGAAAAFARRDL